MDKSGDFVKGLTCDGMCESGVWGIGVEAFPVVTVVADEVGDHAEDLIWYNGVWGGHGVMRRRRRGQYFFMGGRECEDSDGKGDEGGVKSGFGDGYCLF